MNDEHGTRYGLTGPLLTERFRACGTCESATDSRGPTRSDREEHVVYKSRADSPNEPILREHPPAADDACGSILTRVRSTS